MKTNLKTLQTNRKLLFEKKQELTKQLRDNQEKGAGLLKDITKTENEITKIDERIKVLLADVVISEHAIIRYVERVMGINIEEVKSKILSAQTKNIIENLGDGRYPIEGGFIAVRDNVIVTVIGKDNK